MGSKVDNDETKSTARPFVIIAQKRSGGTLLTHCLSAHYSIFCDRGESLHHMSIWRKTASLPRIFHALTNQEGYRASGFRMVYGQAFHKNTWAIIERERPRIIWLTRENILRQGASVALNRLIRRGRVPYYPVHTFRDKSKRPLPQYKVPAENVLKECRQILIQDRKWAKERLGKKHFKVLHLQYHELTGGEGTGTNRLVEATEKKICRFLGVAHRPMETTLKRVHAHPLRAMFQNWQEIEAAVKKSEFAKFLEAENDWIEDNNGNWTVKHG